MKKIMLLGGSSQQIIAIQTAKKLGLVTILCDYLPDNPGQYLADKFYQVSTTDKGAILEVAKKEKIDYIIAYASDPAAPTAAYVAEKTGMPTNPYKSVEILCNKDLFRSFLLEHNFSVPIAHGYQDMKEAIDDSNRYTFPVIIKPVDSSGSKGTTVVRNRNQFRSAIDFAFLYSRSHRIIIEEFIEKKHPYLIGGDIFVVDGKVVQWGLMNCHRDNNVNPLVPVGKSYPPIIDKDDMKNIQKTLQRLVTESGFKFGPMNVEVIVDAKDRVFPIDIGPRSGGNMIPELLGMIFDCNLVEMALLSSMGKTVTITKKEGNPFFATYIIHTADKGHLDHVWFSPEIEKHIVRKNMYKTSGDLVEPFINAAKALGIVFLRFPDNDTMINMEEHMNEYIRVLLKENSE